MFANASRYFRRRKCQVSLLGSLVELAPALERTSSYERMEINPQTGNATASLDSQRSIKGKKT